MKNKNYFNELVALIVQFNTVRLQKIESSIPSKLRKTIEKSTKNSDVLLAGVEASLIISVKITTVTRARAGRCITTFTNKNMLDLDQIIEILYHYCSPSENADTSFPPCVHTQCLH